MSSIESESKFVPDYEDYRSQSVSPIPLREELDISNTTLDDVSDIEIEEVVWTTVDECYEENPEQTLAGYVEAKSLQKEEEEIGRQEEVQVRKVVDTQVKVDTLRVKSSIEASSLVGTSKPHDDGMIITCTDTGRTVRPAPLVKDLRINIGRTKQQLQKEIDQEKHKSQPLGPSGDIEPKQQHCRMILPSSNKLPRGISYAKLPADLLPPNMKFCPICSVPKKSHIRRHVIRSHLPWFWCAHTACWTCEEQTTQRCTVTSHSAFHSQNQPTLNEDNLHKWCQLINGSFFLLAKWLNLDTLDELLEYVLDRKLTAPGSFTNEERIIMAFYTKNYSDDHFDYFNTTKPNHVICLIHFEIITRLLKRIATPKRLKFFETYATPLSSTGLPATSSTILPFPEYFQFIDTHFHLDLIIKRLQRRTSDPLTFTTISETLIHDPNNFMQYGIANYVFPSSWNLWELQTDHPKIFTTFGIHPHVAAFGITHWQTNTLKELIKTPKCVAIGEIGLDFTTNCDCPHVCQNPEICRERLSSSQEHYFLLQLQLASNNNLPVIIHCRDNGDGSAAKRALELIHQHHFEHLFYHRHCFTGSLTEYHDWNRLPHIIFGITGKINFPENLELIFTVSKMSINNIVLETDAPFLTPFSGGFTNHPWNLNEIAQKLSRILNLPLTIMMDIINETSVKFYRLPNV